VWVVWVVWVVVLTLKIILGKKNKNNFYINWNFFNYPPTHLPTDYPQDQQPRNKNIIINVLIIYDNNVK
jgi:hypothetical protein